MVEFHARTYEEIRRKLLRRGQSVELCAGCPLSHIRYSHPFRLSLIAVLGVPLPKRPRTHVINLMVRPNLLFGPPKP